MPTFSDSKIITIIGDSLSVSGNATEEKIFYRDMYPFKLQELLNPLEYYVICRSRKGNTVRSQALEDNLKSDLLFTESTYVILHLGIVDCAPRLFGLMADRILTVCMQMRIVKIFAHGLIKFKSKYRRFFTKYFPKTYVSKKDYKEKYLHILQKIKTEVKPKKVIIINIADTSKENKARSFNFEKNIIEYNAILSEVTFAYPELCQLIDFYSPTKKQKDLISKDGIHPTKKGHIYLAKLLWDAIKRNEYEL